MRKATFLLAGILALLHATWAIGSEFYPVGGLNSARPFTFAYDISGDGRVVVGLSTYSSESSHVQAFRWTREGGIVPLGFAQLSGFESIATAVSFDGSYVIGSSSSAESQTPFRWNESQGMMQISSSNDAHPRLCDAFEVSANGMVVVGTACSDSNEAALWDATHGIVHLGDFAGGPMLSAATAVSADGLTVAGFGYDQDGPRAFRWTDVEGMSPLGDLPGGAVNSLATSISSNGNVIVGGSSSISSGIDATEAFGWSKAAGMFGLGDLAGGSFASSAQDVSEDGGIIVGVASSARSSEAFIWDALHGMRSLYDIAAADPLLSSQVAGWSFHAAIAISNDGTTIVGDGTNPNGHREAWVLRLDTTPIPEPSTIALLATAAITAAAKVLRRLRV